MNIYNNFKRMLPYGLSILTALIIIFCFTFNWDIVFGYGCYENEAKLIDQRVGYLKNNCDNCLIFNVNERECANKEHPCGCWYDNHLLYFATEQQLREDLNEDIIIRWCWVKSIKDYRIRGVFNK